MDLPSHTDEWLIGLILDKTGPDAAAQPGPDTLAHPSLRHVHLPRICKV